MHDQPPLWHIYPLVTELTRRLSELRSRTYRDLHRLPPHDTRPLDPGTRSGWRVVTYRETLNDAVRIIVQIAVPPVAARRARPLLAGGFQMAADGSVRDLDDAELWP